MKKRLKIYTPSTFAPNPFNAGSGFTVSAVQAALSAASPVTYQFATMSGASAFFEAYLQFKGICCLTSPEITVTGALNNDVQTEISRHESVLNKNYKVTVLDFSTAINRINFESTGGQGNIYNVGVLTSFISDETFNEFPCLPATSWSPPELNQNYDYNVNFSGTGQFIGRNVIRTSAQMTIAPLNFTVDESRLNELYEMADSLMKKPAYFVVPGIAGVEHVYYGFTNEPPSISYAGKRQRVSISMNVNVIL